MGHETVPSDAAPGLSALRAVAVSKTSAILSCSTSAAALPPNFSLTASKLATCEQQSGTSRQTSISAALAQLLYFLS